MTVAMEVAVMPISATGKRGDNTNDPLTDATPQCRHIMHQSRVRPGSATGWHPLCVPVGQGKQRAPHQLLPLHERVPCQMVKMAAADHNVYVAYTEFVTHLTGHILDKNLLPVSP